MQIPAVALSLLSAVPADNPQGLPTSDKWPVLQTIGVFAGLPVLGMAIITALVMLQAGTRRARGTSATAVFTGPQAGSVDAAARSGTGPLTETGEASGMHREVAQPGGGGTAPVGQGLDDGGRHAGPTGSDQSGSDASGSESAPTTRAGSTRADQGGSGARW